MQGVRLECLAAVLERDPVKHSRTGDVYDNRYRHYVVHKDAFTSTCPVTNLEMDCEMIQAQVPSNSSVSTNAERFSTFPCP